MTICLPQFMLSHTTKLVVNLQEFFNLSDCATTGRDLGGLEGTVPLEIVLQIHTASFLLEEELSCRHSSFTRYSSCFDSSGPAYSLQLYLTFLY